MKHLNALKLLAISSALLATIGCGDAGQTASDVLEAADGEDRSLCEETCESVSSCERVAVTDDCERDCESERIVAVGSGCEGLIDEMIDCRTGLTCEDHEARALDPEHLDECSVVEKRAALCLSEIDEGVTLEEEVQLACQSACNMLDSCGEDPVITNCEDVCIASQLRDSSDACIAARVDLLNCSVDLGCGTSRLELEGACGDETNAVVASCSDLVREVRRVDDEEILLRIETRDEY